MVQVIARPASKSTTCRTCKCVLEYQFNDMRFGWSHDRDGSKDKVAYITCPNCHTDVYVSTQF